MMPNSEFWNPTHRQGEFGLRGDEVGTVIESFVLLLLGT